MRGIENPRHVVIGHLEFIRDGDEMSINVLAEEGNADGDGDHVATAEGIWDEVWASFLAAARAGNVQEVRHE